MYGHKLSSRSQFYLHQLDGDGPKMTMECMYLNGLPCHLLPKRVMSYYAVDAKKDAEGTADAKELIWNVQAYATVKDVMGNAFESKLAR